MEGGIPRLHRGRIRQHHRRGEGGAGLLLHQRQRARRDRRHPRRQGHPVPPRLLPRRPRPADAARPPDRGVDGRVPRAPGHPGGDAERGARRSIPRPMCWCIPSAAAPASSSTRWVRATWIPEGLHITSTEGMIRAATENAAPAVHRRDRDRHHAPHAADGADKQFIAADPEAVCAYMKTITLRGVRDSLALDRYHVTVPHDIADRARGAIDRMVALGAVTSDAERIAAVALAEDGEIDVTTGLTVPRESRRRRPHRVPERRRGGGRGVRRRGRPGVRLPDRLARPRRHGWSAAGAVDRHRARDGLSRILRAERPMLNLLQRACGIAQCHPGLRGGSRRDVLPNPPYPEDRARAPRARRRGGPGRRRHPPPARSQSRGHGEGQPLAGAPAHGRRAGRQPWPTPARGVSPHCRWRSSRRSSWRRPARQGRPGCWSTTSRRRRCASGRSERGRCAPGIEIEATGGITLENVRAYAEAGADFVSIGALTHSVTAADLGLEVAFGDYAASPFTALPPNARQA